MMADCYYDCYFPQNNNQFYYENVTNNSYTQYDAGYYYYWQSESMEVDTAASPSPYCCYYQQPQQNSEIASTCSFVQQSPYCYQQNQQQETNSNLSSSSTSPSPATSFQKRQQPILSLKQVPGQTWHLWEFLLHLLLDPARYESAIHWTGRDWEFAMSDPQQVAFLWGQYKNKPRMNYEKLARSVRYYYAKKIITKLKPPTRYQYRFESGAGLEQLFGIDMTPQRLFAMTGAHPKPGSSMY